LTALPASKEQEMPPTRGGKSERRDLPLGAHRSIAGGTPRAVERALRAGCRALQIFVKNNTCWIGRPIAAEEAEEFRREFLAATLDALDRAVGLERLTAIHVNDCRKRRGSRIDRHAHIGAGFLGRAGFGHLMREHRLAFIPKYLETPRDPDFAFDRKNLALLRRPARP
jgi:endonuclease IV